MKQTALVSIIVPIYNTESYLHRCVDSLLNQTYDNIEIWLVDDGSTDATATISDEYATRDNRIRVIHKLNGGEASARQAGLEAATGEYVMFCDSDDEYLLDAVEILITAMAGADLIIGGYLEKSGDVTRIMIVNREIYTVPELIREMLSGNVHIYSGYLVSTVNGKLFKRNILAKHKIKFDESFVVGNDTLFMLDYLNHCSTIRGLWKPVYIYYKFHTEERVQGMAWEYPNLYRLEILATEQYLHLAQINGIERKPYLANLFNAILQRLVRGAAYEECFPNGLLAELKYIYSCSIVREAAMHYKRTRIGTSILIPFCLKRGFLRPACWLLRKRAKKFIETNGKQKLVRSIIKKGT